MIIKKSKSFYFIFAAICISILFSTYVSASSSKLSKTEATICVGESFRLRTVDGSNPKDWESSNQRVAIVTNNGTVKSKKTGKTTISVKIGLKKYKCVVTVKNKSIKSIKAKNLDDSTQLSFVFSDNSVEKKTVDYSSWGIPDDQVIHHYEMVDVTGDRRKEVLVFRSYPNTAIGETLLVNVFTIKKGKLKELSYESDIPEINAYSGKIVSLEVEGWPKYGLELECYGKDNGRVYIAHQYILGYKDKKWHIVQSF